MYDRMQFAVGGAEDCMGIIATPPAACDFHIGKGFYEQQRKSSAASSAKSGLASLPFGLSGFLSKPSRQKSKAAAKVPEPEQDVPVHPEGSLPSFQAMLANLSVQDIAALKSFGY